MYYMYTVMNDGTISDMAKINKQRVLKRLVARKSDRKATTLYLSRSLYERFQKACGEHSASEVMEEMMREFLGTN